MAECPGVVHLAAMADGGLARLRTPGGEVTAGQLRGVAEAASRLGSGVVDLTNRANLQIRGLAPDGGPALAAALEAAGFRFHGEADRRRNVLLDPFAGLDPEERLDMRPLGRALDDALVSAPWIARLSPKFSFALDGGGGSGVDAIASDVTVLAVDEGLAVSVGAHRVAVAGDDTEALAAMLSLAEATAELDPAARAKDLWAPQPEQAPRPTSPRRGEVDDASAAAGEGGAGFPERARPPHPALRADLSPPGRGEERGRSRCAFGSLPQGGVDEARRLTPRFGSIPTADPHVVALALAVPVGRLDAAMLGFLADAADRDGCGAVRLAPWSGIVIPSVAAERAAALLRAAEAVGFVPTRVAERLSVVACAGAPSCERAREPAKALGADVLALAAAEPERLPDKRMSLHLSACPKGCAGAAPADLLLLGASERDGWTLHADASPRRPGPERGRLAGPDAAHVLSLLASRG